MRPACHWSKCERRHEQGLVRAAAGNRAAFWRVLRRDGVALGFTAHDRDLWFDGVLHQASPGMLPSSIRKSAGFEADSAEVEGALSHDAISAGTLPLVALMARGC